MLKEGSGTSLFRILTACGDNGDGGSDGYCGDDSTDAGIDSDCTGDSERIDRGDAHNGDDER